MRGKKAKQIRKYIRTNFTDVLFQIRNMIGSKTEILQPTQLYRNCKKYYKQKFFKIS